MIKANEGQPNRTHGEQSNGQQHERWPNVSLSRIPKTCHSWPREVSSSRHFVLSNKSIRIPYLPAIILRHENLAFHSSLADRCRRSRTGFGTGLAPRRQRAVAGTGFPGRICISKSALDHGRVVSVVRGAAPRCVGFGGWQGMEPGRKQRAVAAQRSADEHHVSGQDVDHGWMVQWAVAWSFGEQSGVVIGRWREVEASHRSRRMDAATCCRSGGISRTSVDGWRHGELLLRR